MIGSVYRIIHTQSEICYVGSTFNMLKHRWNGHKNNFKHWNEGKTTNSCSIYPYFKKHGIEKFKIILIKEYEVADRSQLNAYETLWINKFKKSCVNKHQAFGILSAKKHYYEVNKEVINERTKKYKLENKEKLSQKHLCDCGGRYTFGQQSTHFKTKTHIKWANAH